MDKRRIGLGFTGLGDALIELGPALRQRRRARDGRAHRRENARRRLPGLGGDRQGEGRRSRCSTPSSTSPRRASRRACRTTSRPRSASTASATATCCRSRPPAPSRSRSPTTRRTASSPPFSWFYTRKKRMPDDIDEGIPRRGPCLPPVQAHARHRRRRRGRAFDAARPARPARCGPTPTARAARCCRRVRQRAAT